MLNAQRLIVSFQMLPNARLGCISSALDLKNQPSLLVTRLLMLISEIRSFFRLPDWQAARH